MQAAQEIFQSSTHTAGFPKKDGVRLCAWAFRVAPIVARKFSPSALSHKDLSRSPSFHEVEALLPYGMVESDATLDVRLENLYRQSIVLRISCW